MKRGDPMKRTAMARGAGRMKARSPRRERVMVERRALVRLLLAAYPRCQIAVKCEGAPSVDVHERLKRSRGGSIVDPIQAHMVTTCRPCHEFTEAEPARATELRMLLPSWHVCPPIGPC